MNREFLKNAGVPEDAIDKVMAEYGRDLQAEKDKAKQSSDDAASARKELETYKAKVSDLEKAAGDNADVKKELDALKEQIRTEKEAADKKAADEAMTATIRAALPQDKKFVNTYTEKAMIAQIKEELGKNENAGKGVSEIFAALTKDKDGIFANPNLSKTLIPLCVVPMIIRKCGYQICKAFAVEKTMDQVVKFLPHWQGLADGFAGTFGSIAFKTGDGCKRPFHQFQDLTCGVIC